MGMKTHLIVPVQIIPMNPISSARLVVLTNSFQQAARLVVNVMYPANHAQGRARPAQNVMILYSLWTQLVFAQIYLLSRSHPLGRFFAPNTWKYPLALSSVIQFTH